MEKNLKSKSSVQQMQSGLFFANLRKEFSKMSHDSHKDELVKNAHQYIKDGLSMSETKELLKIDGYDPILVEAFANNISQNEEFVEDNTPQWEFVVEDSMGRIFSSSEGGIIVLANTEEEAWEKAEQECQELFTSIGDRIIDVKKV